MLIFLASLLEQLDLALEHALPRDPHNARFSLMLTDNAVELGLHQIAKDKLSLLRNFPDQSENYPHQVTLESALGKSFDNKVKFAKIEGNLTEEIAQTFNILHSFRNEVYHTGLQHESILPNLALFYFDTACRFLGSYQPLWSGWGSNQKLPERAKKYMRGEAFIMGGVDEFKNGCLALAKRCSHNPTETITVITDHMDEVISNQDTCIDIVANGIYEGQRTTRDRAVIECQSWPLAFSETGKKFAVDHGYKGNAFQLAEWLAENYQFKFRHDPITSWRKQSAKLRLKKNPHAALAHYHSFMVETANLREALSELAERVDAEISSAIDRARGK